MTELARNFLRIILLCLPLVVAGLPRVALASDYTPPPGEATAQDMGADVLIHRPIGLARTVVGAALWVVALPFNLLGGNLGESADKLIAEPAKHTFARPLGYSRPVAEH